MRLGIIGAGHVGNIVAYTASLRGLAEEIYFYDINKEKADSEVADLEDGNSFYPHPVKFYVGDERDMASCQVIVVASGRIPEDANRLHEFANNKEDVSQYIPKIMEAGFKGIFIVVTNPCDIITYSVWKHSGLPKEKIIGSGTALDSIRSQGIIARKLGLSPTSVSSMMLGEHGDSQFLPWSQVRVCHQSLDQYLQGKKIKPEDFKKEEIEKESILRGHRVFFGKGATQFGIGNTVNDILSAIKYDSKTCLNVSTLLQGQYGIEDIFISTPCVIGKNGVEQVIELNLNSEELVKYKASANIIQGYVDKL